MTLDSSRGASRLPSTTPSPQSNLLTVSQHTLDHLDQNVSMDLEVSRVSDGATSLPIGASAASLPLSATLSRHPSQPSLRGVAPFFTATAGAERSPSQFSVASPRPATTTSNTGGGGGEGTPTTVAAHGLPRASYGEATVRSSGQPSLLTATPQRSGALSLQSSVNVLTPPLSNAHTPRAAAAGGFMGTGMHGLARFQSAPATPASEVVTVATRPKFSSAEKEREDGGSNDGTPPASATTAKGPVELPMMDEKRANYGGTHGQTADEEDTGEEDASSSSDSRTRSGIEFNSFAAMDSSFISNASSHGGGSGGAGAHHNTLGKAVFHIFKGNVGAGVFLLPTYYQDTGYALGVAVVLILGLLMVDCALALLHSKHAINRTEVKTYPAVVDFVLGSWFRYFTDFALIFTQFGFCVMFVQYASSTFASLFGFPHAYPVCIAINVVLVTPMTFLSNKMNILAYASMLAGAFVVTVLAGTTIVDIDHLRTSGIAPGVVAFFPTARILVFLSGHMFSLEGIGIVLPVENSLAPEQRKPFGHVVKYTLMGIVVLYIIFGVLGYCAYGDDLHTSVVLALPKGMMKKMLQCLLGLSLIFGYPIQYVPAIQLVDRAIRVNVRRDRVKAYVMRTVLNATFGLLALFIGGDALNIFASFLGAFAGVHLMITLPALLALQLDNALDPNRGNLTYTQYMMQMFRGPLTWHRVRRYLYLVLALVVWIGGLYFTFDSVFGRTTPENNDLTTTLAPTNTTVSP